MDNRYVGLAIALAVMVASPRAAGLSRGRLAQSEAVRRSRWPFIPVRWRKRKRSTHHGRRAESRTCRVIFVAAWPRRSRLKESRDPNRSWVTW